MSRTARHFHPRPLHPQSSIYTDPTQTNSQTANNNQILRMSIENFLSYNAANKDADPLYLFDPNAADLLWPITATQIPTVLVSGWLGGYA